MAKWNTTLVTNMASMFSGKGQFNAPIMDWDVSNVRDALGMFYGAGKFNQPIHVWDMYSCGGRVMFLGAVSFDQPINKYWGYVGGIDMFHGATAWYARYVHSNSN